MSTVPYKVIRSKRRTLALTIDKEARLIVRAPMRLSEDLIRDFIKEKEQWISEKQQQTRLYAAQYSTFSLKNGEVILYLGKPHIIQRQSVEEVTIAADKLLVPEDMTLAVFREWMKAESRALIRERVDYYAHMMEVKYASVKISEARRRWGSCGAANTLNFTWRLIMCPPSVIDYVVVHELSHITYKDHSARFWKLVAEVMPNYKKEQKWLRQNRGLMDII